jgi:valyl-tRNA synthetase
MGRLSILLCSLLFVSCSVKKRTTKVSQDIKTEVSTITKVVKQDSIKYDSDTYEIIVEQKDSLKPISVILNGVESTFSNAKSVTIRKKKESLRTHLNEFKEIVKDSVVVEKTKEKLFEKEKSFDYKALYPIFFVVVFFVLLRTILSKFSLF